MKCQEIALLLADKKYEAIEKLSAGTRLSASDLSNAVNQYGRTLLPLPEEGLDLITVFELTGLPQAGWAVDVPLWSEEEGRSDLTLSLRLIDQGRGELKVEVNDLHVL